MNSKFQELIDNHMEQLPLWIKILDNHLESMQYNFEDSMQKYIPKKIEETLEQLHKVL